MSNPLSPPEYEMELTSSSASGRKRRMRALTPENDATVFESQPGQNALQYSGQWSASSGTRLNSGEDDDLEEEEVRQLWIAALSVPLVADALGPVEGAAPEETQTGQAARLGFSRNFRRW